MEKRFFTIEDNQTLIYFQLPKVLMIAEKYKKLSNDAKLLYTYYLDMNKRSMKNNWKDKDGRYYIKFKDVNAMAFIGCATEKFTKLKKELLKYDLIHIQKTGQGKTNITYVLKLEYTDEDVFRANEVFDEVGDDADKSDQEADLRKSKVSRESKDESSDLRKSKVLDFENRKSRSLKIESLEVRKSKDISKNYSIENDFKENDYNENNLKSSSSLNVDEQSYIEQKRTEEEEERIKEMLTYLGTEIAEYGIMRTNKQINETIALIVKRELFDFDKLDVSVAINHYKEECKTRNIGQPPLFFVNGFELKMNQRHSGQIGKAERDAKKKSPVDKSKITRPTYNWLDEA